MLKKIEVAECPHCRGHINLEDMRQLLAKEEEEATVVIDMSKVPQKEVKGKKRTYRKRTTKAQKLNLIADYFRAHKIVKQRSRNDMIRAIFGRNGDTSLCNIIDSAENRSYGLVNPKYFMTLKGKKLYKYDWVSRVTGPGKILHEELRAAKDGLRF
jgi:hypothetical protein